MLEVKGLPDIPVRAICFDSREARKGSLFVAVKGSRVDGHKFIQQVEEKGVVAVVCETYPKSLREEITYIRVKNSSAALGYIASNFYNAPSSKLKLVGITGTNGKTTIATLLYNLFSGLGYPAALISTIQNEIQGRMLPATHTTPDAIGINKILNEAVEQGCEFCFMEVSSHASDQDRIAGLDFAGGIFTNITHEHLDYHAGFREYLLAKQKFFNQLSPNAFALTNLDDKNGRIMVQNTRAVIYAYSLKTFADFKCKVMENHFGGLVLQLNGREFYSRLIGYFNAYNILAVYATAMLLGQEQDEVLAILSDLQAVEGRFEYIRNDKNITGIIDYAHTPDALENVLDTISSIRTGNEQLITVVGAGGDRDRKKRPLMAGISAVRSDRVILTSDNPRSEDPQKIIDDMLQGIGPELSGKVISIINRREAIKTACAIAQNGDIILVAGKGHEKYQEIKGVRHPFDDKEILSYELFKNQQKN